MIRFIFGLISGLYIATYYDCKPTIEYVIEQVKENVPKKKI